MLLNDINIRDPFILADDGHYYMYGTRGASTWGCGTGFDVYVSDNLESWSGPHECFARPADFWADRNFWAPEVHKYRGRYYMLASFKSETACRGTQILVADTPMGPFRLHSDGPVAPRDWECLDGTLYVDAQGTPYMVFCHEWLQVHDGGMCAIQLSDDLTHSVGEATTLFHASEPAWAKQGAKDYVTDGPFIYTTASGRLIMLWSSSAADGYCEGLTYSDGDIFGPWKHDERLLFSRDGGHGMLFKTFDGQLMFVLHQPNNTPDERPRLIYVCEKDDTLWVKP